MASNDCIPIFDRGSYEQREALTKIAKKWLTNKKILALTNGSHKDFKTFYHQELPWLDFDMSRLPNSREMGNLDRAVDRYLKALTKDTGKIGRLFKLPENILSKTPATKQFFENMVYASNFYRGNLQEITSDLNIIKNSLNSAAGESFIASKFNINKSQAQKKIQKLYTQYKKLDKEGKKEAAKKFYDEHLSDKALRGSKDNQLQAMQKLWELMVNPKLMRLQDAGKVKLEYGADLYEAARIWHYGDKSAGVLPLKERLWKMLGNGLKDNISMLKDVRSSYNKKGTNYQIEKLEKLYNDYFSPKASKKVEDYFPRQVLDIAPTFARLSDDIHSGYVDAHPQHVSKYIDQMVNSVTQNLKVPGSTFERGQGSPKRVSKDVLDILDTYAHNTARFNYNARVSKSTIKAIKDLHSLKDKNFDSHLRQLHDYVMETHDSALGLTFRNNKLGNISRAITSWQFISKLGFNARTVARNATQSLQNWVYFGHQSILKSMDGMKSESMKKIISEEMGRHGYEFVNIQEFAMPRELMSNINIDANGKVVQMEPGNFTKFNKYLEEIATISGKPMQWVENNVNRGLTFKLAFMEKWNALKNDGIIRQKLQRDKKFKTDEKSTADEKLSDAIVKERRRMASNYAANVVKELHYLYDPWAKPAITRSPIGSVLGQFTTYSINFFEYQRKIAAKAGNDILAKEWNSPNAWKFYRLGMLYTFITGLGAVTNTNFNNLVQNDTWERLDRLDQYLRGDEEAKEKAFFGKDPITATFGGPFVSDVLKIGSLINFQRMGADEFTSYTDFYSRAAEKTKDEKIEEFVRMLNTQAGRFIYTTMPNMINGAGVPTLLGQELGLYNTPELSKWKDKMLYPLQNYLPKPVSDYFTPKKTSIPQEPGTYTDEEMDAIMMVLENMRK